MVVPIARSMMAMRSARIFFQRMLLRGYRYVGFLGGREGAWAERAGYSVGGGLSSGAL